MSVMGEPVVNPTVAALNALQIYDPDQAAAYREHARHVAAVLGDDFSTRLADWVGNWARTGGPAALILTGNAGTGKTAAAEAYCTVLGAPLPLEPKEVQLAPDRFLVKDLSDFGAVETRAGLLEHAWQIGTGAADAMALVCANEGMLRGTLDRVADQAFSSQVLAVLDRAMAEGVGVESNLVIVNVNRQRATSAPLWAGMVDYLASEEKWSACIELKCPARDMCPMRLNAAEWRRSEVSEAGRSLVRLATGAAVPTLREVLSLLSWSITSRLDCETVQRRKQDLGRDAFSAERAYYHLFQGGGLTHVAFEQSPLLARIAEAEVGEKADIGVDLWLRDQADAPEEVIALATGRTPQGRVDTSLGVMSFSDFGGLLTTSEDSSTVVALTRDLVHPERGVLRIWRRGTFFSWRSSFGTIDGAFSRLSRFSFFGELVKAAEAVRAGNSDTTLVKTLISGLNYLATGIADPGEGLIVPDTGSLFARDPGAFRPVGTSVVHTRVPASRITLAVEDAGMILEIVDWDDVLLTLEVDDGKTARLRLTPRLFQAIREAAEFRGPIGSGVAEMAELQSFYAGIAQVTGEGDLDEFRVVDPDAGTIRTVVLPGV